MLGNIGSIKEFEPGLSSSNFESMLRRFPPGHFAKLVREKFQFYGTTFWYPLEREPENIFELAIRSLKEKANPSDNVIGIEWWFSVLLTNSTPQWLLGCHFDRDNVFEKDIKKINHPEFSSVLFMNSVPYGELVITDQILTEDGISTRQPKEMRFIQPRKNVYAVFPGHLYHGVIGRMWRPYSDTRLRITMAVNYWTEKPAGPYLGDSRDCISTFKLDSALETETL
jgi:hypothetical protein